MSNPSGANGRPPSARGIHQRFNGTMHVSARVDYGMRAACELAVMAAQDPARRMTTDGLCSQHAIPSKFCENILRALRRAGIVESKRGADGGFRLAKPANEVSVADVVRALDGPLVDVRGEAPEELTYDGGAQHLGEVWVATRAAVRGVLETITLADVVSGRFPEPVRHLLDGPGAWRRRAVAEATAP